MGCTYTKQQLTPMSPCKTLNGVLKVTVQEANIYKRSKISSMDPYLRLTMSNQQFRGYIHKKAGRNNVFNESFEFVVNSCFKPDGRSMTVELWNKSMMNDKIIGMSIIDLHPIIGAADEKDAGMNQSRMMGKQSFFYMMQDEDRGKEMKRTLCKMKVHLNQGVEEVGYLNTVFEFIQEPITTIGLKFIYASLRRTSAIFTTMNCSVQAICGQQILRTHIKKDKDTKNPPSWEDQTLMFNIPKSLKECMIRVLDDDKQVGHLRFAFLDLMAKKGEFYFTEQLQHEQAISGVVKFCVMVGIESVVAGSRKGSKSRIQQQIVRTEPNQQMTQMQRELPNQEQNYIEMKRELPSEKSTRMQESEFRTLEYTQPNEEEPSREPIKEIGKEPLREMEKEPLKVHKVDESIIVVNGEQLKK